MIWLFVLAALFISSDVIAIRPASFTVRPAEVCMAITAFLSLFRLIAPRPPRWPLGFGALLLWTLLVVALVPNTPFLSRSVGYAAWLLLNVLFVFSAVQFIDTHEKLNFVLRWYAYSFGVIAAIGLLQFTLPFVGITPPFLQQWWIEGRLARINGLSYETSFFSLYMVVGWIFVSSLAKLKPGLLPPRTVLWLIVLTTAALILSGSRTGWMLMIAGLLLLRPKRGILITAAACLLAAIPVVQYFASRYQLDSADVEFLISGTGLLGSSAHSLDPRIEGLEDTFRVFERHPIVGVSLGGVLPAIATLHGTQVHNQDDLAIYQSLSSTLEVLAATGILGFPYYAAYIALLLYKPWKLSRDSPLLRSMVVPFIAIVGIMQYSGNILQGFVWLHIALLCATYQVVRMDGRTGNPGQYFTNEILPSGDESAPYAKAKVTSA